MVLYNLPQNFRREELFLRLNITKFLAVIVSFSSLRSPKLRLGCDLIRCQEHGLEVLRHLGHLLELSGQVEVSVLFFFLLHVFLILSAVSVVLASRQVTLLLRLFTEVRL